MLKKFLRTKTKFDLVIALAFATWTDKYVQRGGHWNSVLFYFKDMSRAETLI